MKNILKEEKELIIATLIYSIFVSICISLVPALAGRNDPGFVETLKTSIPLAVLTFIIIWIVVFANIKHFFNLKNNIIQKFNLKKGEYVEVDVIDTFAMKEDIVMLANAIKNLDSTSNIASVIIINGKEIKLAFDNIRPSFDVLIDIIKRLNGKFFIHLDNENKISWCLKNSSDTVICEGHTRCEAEYFQMLNCFSLKE